MYYILLEVIIMDEIFAKPAKSETHSSALYLRVYPSIHDKFEMMRKKLNLSQSEMFSRMVLFAEKDVLKDSDR